MLNYEELVGFEFPYKLMNSLPSCPDYTACPPSVKGSIVCIWVLMSCVMITTFSFKILHNLLSRYTSGPGPSDTAWQHLLEFLRPILRHTSRCSKNRVFILKKIQKKLKDEMIWGKRNYNPTIQTPTSIKNQNSRSHSSQCTYWKRKIVNISNYSYFSGVYSHLYLRRFTYNPGSCTAGSVHQSIQKERKPIH